MRKHHSLLTSIFVHFFIHESMYMCLFRLSIHVIRANFMDNAIIEEVRYRLQLFEKTVGTTI